MGLHTIDTVRRDAALAKIWFETLLLAGEKAEVVLTRGETQIVYTIDMELDVIEKIKFSGDKEGEIRFNYIKKIDDINREFAEPKRSREGMQTGNIILNF